MGLKRGDDSVAISRLRFIDSTRDVAKPVSDR